MEQRTATNNGNLGRGSRFTGHTNVHRSQQQQTDGAAAAHLQFDHIGGGNRQSAAPTNSPHQQQSQDQQEQPPQPLPLEPQISAPSSLSDEAFVLESPTNPYLSSPTAIMMGSTPPHGAAYNVQDDDEQQHTYDYHEHFQKVLDGENTTQSGLSSSSTSNNNQQLQSHNLASQSINSEDDSGDQVAYGELAQPRPEIILRWKRFALLVFLAVAFISSFTWWLVNGIELADVEESQAESRVDTINSYSGIVMGFCESFLGLLLGNLFPVFIVYLHNLKWFPGDDPAIKSSKFKKIALMLFIPLIMVALGNSLSAVQANQRTESSVSRMRARHLLQKSDSGVVDPSSHPSRRSLLAQNADANEVVLPLEETILRSAVTRRVVPVPPARASSCANSEQTNGVSDDQSSLDGILHALPAATFGFPLKNWNKEVYPDPLSWDTTTKISVIPAGSISSDQVSTQANDVMTYSTAFELLFHGLNQFKSSLATSRDVDDFDVSAVESLSGYLSGAQAANASNLLSEIATGFQKFHLGELDVGSLSVTLQKSALSSLVRLETMTIEIPIGSSNSSSQAASAGNSRLVCGSQSCVLLDGEDQLQLPRKQISMMQYLKNCTAMSGQNLGECQSEPNTAFLYGFTSTTQGETQDSTSPSRVTPRRSLVFSFGKLSWSFDDFLHSCDPSSATGNAHDDCRVLHHKLTPSSRHVVVGANSLPESLQATSFANPIRLIQLIERRSILSAADGTLTVHIKPLTNGKQFLSAIGSGRCSAAVDSYQQYVERNHFTLDQHLVQPMYTAALLYLFQNGAVIDAAETVEMAISRRLAAQATGDSYMNVYLSNTNVGQVSTWLGCGVLLVLSMLVICLPNERARLEPSKGGNHRAERFIAVQTEESYPNFVYKKRFLIGKTGEEIKFGEFAVESVGLHHKMEEDEQIYL